MTYTDSSLLQSDIIAGSITLNNSSTSTAVVTIPAGRVFKGSITLTICNTGTAAATFDTIDALTVGAGVLPAVGSVLLRTQTHAGLTAAEVDSVTAQDVVVKAPAANDVTINAKLSAAATTLNGTCSITGLLIG